jgi:hypothetical protein
VLKTEREPTMEAIASMHESRILKEFPRARFERLSSLEQSDRTVGEPARTIVRVGVIDAKYGGPEYSIYRDATGGVLLVVLLCSNGKDQVYFPALKWIAGGAILMHREGN